MKRILSLVFLGLFGVAGVTLVLFGLGLVFGAVTAAFEADWEEALLNGIGAFMFGGGGLLMVWVAVRVVRTGGHHQRAAARFPDEPWRWRREWADGQIRSSGISSFPLWAVWLVVLVVNAMSWPVAALVPAEVADGNYLMLGALVFPLAAIGVAVFAIRLTLRRRRYGRSVLVLQTFPGRTGGELRGDIHVPRGLAVNATIELTLACVHREIERFSDEDDRVHEHVEWQQSLQSSPAANPRGAEVVVPLAFAVPSGTPPSSPLPGDDEILWRLDARAQVAGVDYAASFEVPVFPA